eukprot:TRINITY_DN430_c0_g1_i8.p2 TRINITY_DN430_c0_g1~~TRINITY_DN430_c0_g1_i8.p2  ORF type:complete len:163 (-),score=50.77 TRINITY_DN430_c0_g1_i8:131-619(-)
MTFFFLMIRRPPRSTQSRSSAASDVYKRQVSTQSTWGIQFYFQYLTNQKMANLAVVTKTVGGITAILVCIACILSMFHYGFLYLGFKPINIMIVSAILACAEFEVEFVRKWFHILQYYWGKALFYLFLGTVMYDNYDLFHWVTSIILLVVGIIYLIFECTQK